MNRVVIGPPAQASPSSSSTSKRLFNALLFHPLITKEEGQPDSESGADNVIVQLDSKYYSVKLQFHNLNTEYSSPLHHQPRAQAQALIYTFDTCTLSTFDAWKLGFEKELQYSTTDLPDIVLVVGCNDTTTATTTTTTTTTATLDLILDYCIERQFEFIDWPSSATAASANDDSHLKDYEREKVGVDRVVEALQANTDWENMVMKPQDYHNRYNLHRKEGNKSFIEEVEDDDNQQDRQKVEDGVVVEEDDEQWIDDDEEFDDDDDDDDDEILAEMNKYLSLDDDENNDNTSTHSTNLELEAELKHLKSLFHSLKDNDLSSSASPPVSTITPTTTTSDDLGIDIDGDKHALNDQDLDADHISLMFAKLQKLKESSTTLPDQERRRLAARVAMSFLDNF